MVTAWAVVDEHDRVQVVLKDHPGDLRRPGIRIVELHDETRCATTGPERAT